MGLTVPTNKLETQTVSSSFDQLLYLDSPTGLVEATLKIVSTEVGHSAVQLDDERLLVKGVDTSNAAAFDVQNTGGTSIFKVNASTAGTTTIGTVTVGVDDAGHDVKFFGNTASAYMLWDASQDDLIIGGAGKVGIGATSPKGNLQIIDASTSANLQLQGASGAYGANMNFWADAGVDATDGYSLGVSDTGVFRFRKSTGNAASSSGLGTWGTTVMTLDNNGDVGIGTTSPSTRLTVAETTANENVEIKLSGLSANGSGRSGTLGYCPDADVADNNYLYLTGSGNATLTVRHNDRVGIMTSDPGCTLDIHGTLSIGTRSEVTISSGVLTITESFHKVDTEGDASSDDVDTISGGHVGMILVLVAHNTHRTVVLKDGTGNLLLGDDFSLDTTHDSIMLIFNGTNWHQVSTANNS